MASQGIGGGALLIIAQAICIDIVSIRERNKYQVIFEVMATVGNGVGPIVGGVFAEVACECLLPLTLP